MTQQPGPWSAGVPGAPVGPVPPYAPPPVPPPPSDGQWRAQRIDPVPGTPFSVALLDVPPVVSGLAVGSLVAGVLAILVSLAMLCLGMVGAAQGWDIWVTVSFAVLATVAGCSGVGLGVGALRQVRRSQEPGRLRFTGRGCAVGGVVSAGTGLLITFLTLAFTVLMRLS